MKKRYSFFIFWSFMFAVAFFVLSQSGYSDGDDQYFYQYTHSMGFFEYLGWRYETWVGRLAAEALVYITFHLGLWFWRGMNAAMLVLLPIGILRLSAKAARIPDGNLLHWCEKRQACETQDYHSMGIVAAAAAVSGYLLMSVMTLGYAAVWVNGSIFYTWTFTCGIWALLPFADCVFLVEEGSRETKFHFSVKGTDWKKFLYAVPCAIIASMSIEQMGAVLLVFEVLGLLYCMLKWHRVHALLLLQTLVTLAAFLILFAAPGNAIRVTAEIVNWMPEYETMSGGQHLFITVQWLLSSFANESKLLFCGIWIAGMMLLWQRKKPGKQEWFFSGAAVVFTVVSLLPYVGITVLSDMGMGISDITVCIPKVPEIGMLTAENFAAMLWWFAALIFTFVFLWKVSGCQVTLLLAYLAGIASEAIMFFSPTMYASGARVYYLTDLLYLFVILCLSFGIFEEQKRRIFYGILIAMGLFNFVFQIPVFLGQIR